MTIPILIILLFVALYIVSRLAGFQWSLHKRLFKRMPKVEHESRQFVISTVERMLEDERATAFVYTRIQNDANDQSYLLALMSIFFAASLITVTEEANAGATLISLVSACVCLAGMWALERVDTRAERYREVIDLYEEKLGLPKRP